MRNDDHEGLAAAIRALARSRGDPAVSSVYLDVAGADRPVAAQYEDAFDRLAADLRRQARARADARISRSVAGDIKAMADRLHGIDRARVRGLAMFSCSEQGWFEAVELPHAVRDEAAIAARPRIRPLVELLDEPEPLLVAVVDRERLRLLWVDGGAVHEEPAFVTPSERSIDVSIELGSFEHHDEEAGRVHFRAAAAALDDAVAERDVGHVVLGGPDEAVAELERYLHPTTNVLVIGRIGVRAAASAEEIAQAARLVGESAERRREAALVEELRQRAAGGHLAVVGLEPTLDALVERRVGTLLVSDGFMASGAACPACGHMGAATRLCPACGARNVEVDDVVELAIEEAVAQDAAVEFCRGTDLDRFGRIAALERY